MLALGVGAFAAIDGQDPATRAVTVARSPYRPVPAPATPRLVAGPHLRASLSAPVLLHAAPGGRVLARLATRTEFGSARVLAVLERRGAWLGVQAPELRNGEIGWITARPPRVRLGRLSDSLHVDLSERHLEHRRGGRLLRRLSVAVGRAGHRTPTGRFAVTDRLRITDPRSPYGCCAIALSGHQPNVPQGWSGGDRLAIHGTNAEWSVGRAASLGCLRARAPDIRALMRSVPLGTPVYVRA